MQRKILGSRIYFGSLILLAAALPFWLLLMSISQFLLVGAWFIHGRIKEKIASAFKNKALLAVLGIYILHVIGVIYSTDLDYSLDDLRVKLPLFLLPLIVATMPKLSARQFHVLLNTVVVAVFLSTLCSLIILTGITGKSIENIRDISVFISHIRLALLICMCIIICIYFIAGNKRNVRYAYYAFIAWFVFFLFLLQSLTGLGILAALLLAGIIRIIIRSRHRPLKIAAVLMFICFASGGIYLYKLLFVESVKPLKIEASALKLKTVNGNPYTHFTMMQDEENGNPVWININEEEMRKAWNRKSMIPYDSLDLRNQEIKYTLIRFLSSCGYDKDSAGISKLLQAEIKAVEKGIANRDYIYQNSIITRLRQLAWEYRNYYYSGNPSGHSVMQRFEFWKTGLYIFKSNFWTGTGTGDIRNAFAKAYEELDSRLLPAFRLRAHNEYLTMFITFGFFGGLYFLFALFYPYFKLKKQSDFLYSAFLIILLLSMVMEDTPESQPGATFMAFFNSILLFHSYRRPGHKALSPEN